MTTKIKSYGNVNPLPGFDTPEAEAARAAERKAKTQTTDKATARPLIIDRTTRKGFGDLFLHIVQDGEGEEANEILRVIAGHSEEQCESSRRILENVLQAVNEHDALCSVAEAAWRETKKINNHYYRPTNQEEWTPLELALAALAALRKEGGM